MISIKRALAVFAAALVLVWTGEAVAQANEGGLGGPVSFVSYTGPIDAVGISAVAAYSCTRAPRAAVVSTVACNLRRASDSTSQDINYLANGNFDSSSATSFAGTDGTGTCLTSGSSTTLSCTGWSNGSTAPVAGDTLFGVGLVLPAYIVSCGSFVAGTGTCTMNAAQTLSSHTFTFTYGLYVAKMYDKSGANECSSAACDVSQGTAANQPQWLPGCLGSLPCVNTGQSISVTLTSASTFATLTQPQTLVGVADQISTSSGQNQLVLQFSNGSTTFQFGGSSSSNLAFASAGTAQTATMSNNAVHSEIVVMNGASSNFYIDNTATSINPNTGGPQTQVLFGNSTGVNKQYQGYIGEALLFGTNFSSGNATSECHNQRLYYTGIGGSC